MNLKKNLFLERRGFGLDWIGWEGDGMESEGSEGEGLLNFHFISKNLGGAG